MQGPISMEVGIEELLNISILINNRVYFLDDAIEGEIYFKTVKLQVLKMELNILRKEVVGVAEQSTTTAQEISSYEIMDGCPVNESKIPIRLFLKGVSDLGPTMSRVNNRFSVKYFLDLKIIDEMNRKYFKQHEIILLRKKPAPSKTE